MSIGYHHWAVMLGMMVMDWVLCSSFVNFIVMRKQITGTNKIQQIFQIETNLEAEGWETVNGKE